MKTISCIIITDAAAAAAAVIVAQIVCQWFASSWEVRAKGENEVDERMTSFRKVLPLNPKYRAAIGGNIYVMHCEFVKLLNLFRVEKY